MIIHGLTFWATLYASGTVAYMLTDNNYFNSCVLWNQAAWLLPANCAMLCV